ncbi:ribosome biogenesis protein [Candidatus Micrarchaeota archaeon]|nr:ribosome biogenesis protein [Candidatus Micrarchaeota archaeon]
MGLKKCGKCHSYALKGECGNCLIQTISPHPPKYSPQDKYAQIRRIEKFGE